MEKPIFNSTEQAVTVALEMLKALTSVTAWAILWGAHVALAVVGMAVIWWFEVTPAEVQSAVRAFLSSTTFAVGSAIGLSLLGLLAAYLAAVRWLWGKTFVPWLSTRLLQALRPEGV